MSVYGILMSSLMALPVEEPIPNPKRGVGQEISIRPNVQVGMVRVRVPAGTLIRLLPIHNLVITLVVALTGRLLHHEGPAGAGLQVRDDPVRTQRFRIPREIGEQHSLAIWRKDGPYRKGLLGQFESCFQVRGDNVDVSCVAWKIAL